MASGSVEDVTRHLNGGRQLEIRVLERGEEAVTILKAMSGVSNVNAISTTSEPANQLIQADFTGDDQALHSMLVSLITHDIPVISFAPRSSGGRLEEVFMTITEGSSPS